MSLWFSASAVGPALMLEWHISAAQASWFTNAVQIGFVAGGLTSASLNLAEALRSADRGAEAIEMLRLFAEAHPNDLMAEMNYAVALTIEGDPASAQPTFTKLLSRDDLTVE